MILNEKERLAAFWARQWTTMGRAADAPSWEDQVTAPPPVHTHLSELATVATQRDNPLKAAVATLAAHLAAQSEMDTP